MSGKIAPPHIHKQDAQNACTNIVQVLLNQHHPSRGSLHHWTSATVTLMLHTCTHFLSRIPHAPSHQSFKPSIHQPCCFLSLNRHRLTKMLLQRSSDINVYWFKFAQAMQLCGSKRCISIILSCTSTDRAS